MANFNIDYLVVAGGGAGGGFYRGGGGGAGELKESASSIALNTATPYTVTVGAGGTGVVVSSDNGSNGNNGDNSTFYNITSLGGGGGSPGDSSSGNTGSDGGSGGGAGGNWGGTSANGGSANGTGLGNNGGAGAIVQCGGGGGGATQSGFTAGTSGTAGDGGAGKTYTAATSITGQAFSIAGGGGGANYESGNITVGGIGGGAAGASGTSYTSGPSAANNTGGGGGGGNGVSPQGAGGAGGSGVVILRYTTSDVASYTTTGITPTETTDGTDTILSFTTVGTGTITFSTPSPPPFGGTKVTTPVTDFNKPLTEEGLKIPSGTSSNQPTGIEGMVRNDTTHAAITYYNGTNWRYFEVDPSGSLVFVPASSVASGQINANKPINQNFTFTRASTATFLGSNNLLQTAASGMPRIDYVGNSSGHILLEPSRTNELPHSNNLSNNPWWGKRNGSVSKNIVSPTGTANDAWTLTTDGGGLSKRVGMRMRNGGNDQITIPAGTSKTFSIFVKKSSYDFVYFNSTKFQNDMKGDSFFNISNGTLGTVSSNNSNQKIEDYGNGWYRLSVTVTAPANPTDNVGQINWYAADSDNTIFVTADGTSTSFWYGGQIEVGEYGTSYIETDTASVTRAAETATDAGNSTLFNDSEGVLYFEGSFNELSRLGISENASTSNRILIGQSSSSLSYIATSASIPVVNNNVSGYQFNQNLKIAAKYKQNDFALWVNGIEIVTVSSGNTPTGLNSLDLKGQGFNTYGKVKQIRVYNTALTDEELAILTT